MDIYDTLGTARSVRLDRTALEALETVRDAALPYVRVAIAGDIDAVVAYPAVFGAHAVLTTYYGHSNEDASRRVSKS